MPYCNFYHFRNSKLVLKKTQPTKLEWAVVKVVMYILHTSPQAKFMGKDTKGKEEKALKPLRT